jgi:hypothetical protein
MVDLNTHSFPYQEGISATEPPLRQLLAEMLRLTALTVDTSQATRARLAEL